MTKVALKAKDIYTELRALIVEARRSGLEKHESYKKLIDALDALALALHRMLYVNEKLDPEVEEAIKRALTFPVEEFE